MKNRYDVVGGPFEIEHLCKYLCDKYKLNKYVSYSLDHSCDENFNFVLISEKGKYFVKIFNVKYNEMYALDFVERYKLFIQISNIKMLLDNEKSKITKIRIDEDRIFYICVMDYIEGTKLIDVNKEDLHKINEFLYDLSKREVSSDIKHNPATFIDLKETYERYGEVLDKSYKEGIEEILESMKKIHYRNLKKSFVHNGMMKGSILKEDEKLYFIRFGYSGYGYKLLDVISVLNSVIYNGKNLKTVVSLWNTFMNEYKEKNPLTVEEKKYFDLLFKADCLAKYTFYKYNYKVNKNKSYKDPYKNIGKLIEFLDGKEIKV